jgi:hypothetical protein
VRFRVFLHGRNALINTDGTPQRLAFFATRIVDAADEKEAESHAIDLVKADDWLRTSLLNADADPFLLSVEEIEEAAWDETAIVGYSWYPMK